MGEGARPCWRQSRGRELSFAGICDPRGNNGLCSMRGSDASQSAVCPENMDVVTVTMAPNELDLASRLEVSQGTQDAVTSSEASNYERRARLPISRWRGANKAECQRFVRPLGEWRHSSTIALVRPNGRLRYKLRTYQLQDDNVEALLNQQVEDHVRSFADIIDELCEFGNPVLYHGISLDLPNATSLTVNNDGLRIGLHFDSWDGLA